MDKVMVRFLTSIGLRDHERFDLSFDLVARNPFKKEQLDMVIVKDEPWNYELLAEFLEAIYRINYPCTFRFSYKRKPTTNDMLRLFDHFYQVNYRMPPEFIYRSSETALVFEYESEAIKASHDEKFAKFQELLKFINYEVAIEHIVVTPIIKADEKTVSRLNKKAERVIDLDENNPFIDNDETHEERRGVAETALCNELEDNYKRMEEERRAKNVFKRGDYQPLPIKDFTLMTGNVDFNGRVFSAKRFETNRGVAIFTFGVGLDGHAIDVKAIEDKHNLVADKLDAIKIGCHVRVRGATASDKYSNELMVMAHYVDLIPGPGLRLDESPEKRVELHLHTKMSAMDAVGEIDDYCRLAAHMGHQAIAITDHGVVQGFPEAQKAAKKHGLKMIYGVEMYMIDDDPGYIMNPSDANLDDSTYIAFDLETTGLSIEDDRIIEFGAVKIQKGLVVSTLDILIDPGIKLGKKTVEITNITDAMLKGQPRIEEALPRIMAFIGNDILISH
ncbi:MAG: PHP domain-containing protein, partial [Bacilli bacterium]